MADGTGGFVAVGTGGFVADGAGGFVADGAGGFVADGAGEPIPGEGRDSARPPSPHPVPTSRSIDNDTAKQIIATENTLPLKGPPF